MHILITGCNGQLGLQLINQLSQNKGVHELTKTNRYTMDITDYKQVFNLIETLRPDVVINCAAYTNVDQCETDEMNAFQTNAMGPQYLSAAAFKVNAKIIQLSTDYVFNGEGNLPKKEFDPTCPINCYGRSKAHGDNLVKETNPRHFVIRTGWLYGQGKNFVTTMLKLAKERAPIDVINDQIGSPTSTVDLAKCITSLLNTEAYGTYHATSEGACSWYDFAVKIFELSNLDIKVNPITSKQLSRLAQRPKFSVLDNFMLKIQGLNTFRNWEDSLEAYITTELRSMKR